MKVLFNCPVPFMLAHGGAQVQLEQTMAALTRVGVEVEPLRWWEPDQAGDILHHFGRVPFELLNLAHSKGLKVVQEELLTEQGSRSRFQLWAQKAAIRALRQLLPRKLTAAFSWDAYKAADASIANTPWESRLMREVFGAPPERVHVLPNGVEEVFLDSAPLPRGEWLVCTATITERKRVVELACAAAIAKTPVWFIGRPYSEADAYAGKFLAIAGKHPNLIRFEGAIEDRARLARVYRQARGFVLLSGMETRSLAAEEAAACGCPLLLSDLPWARSVYAGSASYCPTSATGREMASYLRRFHDAAPNLPVPPRPLSWPRVAEQLKELYTQVLKGPAYNKEEKSPRPGASAATA